MRMEKTKPHIHSVGEFPTNSRIKIRYPTKGPPKINFEYPDNERQLKSLWSSSGIMLPAMILTIITIVIIYGLIYFLIPTQYPNCFVYSNGDSYSTIDIGVVVLHPVTIVNNLSSIVIYCGKSSSFLVHWIKSPLTFQNTLSINNNTGLSALLIGLFVICLYFAGIYGYAKLLAHFVKKTKFGHNHYPGWNKTIHNKHFMAEFITCPDNLKIELPLFTNIYLDYEAEEEFADYLKEVEIVEHDVKYVKRRLFKPKKIIVPNVYLWKAVFTFKRKPTKGFLRINFT